MGAQPSGSPAAQVKTERLLNLVMALLATRMPLSKARIRAAVPQYRMTASDEAFDRMFERDKDELRELGIPLVTAVIDPVFDDELGYRIDKREYALPEIAFEPDEVTALSLAARTWTRASLAGPAASGLRKLRAAGVTMDERSLVGIEPVVRTTEEAFEPLRWAVRDRQAVSFGYRKLDEESQLRRLQPWGLAQWHGRWYLTGYDLDREAPRVFRMSRIDTAVRATGPVGAYEVPADHDARVMVETTQVSSAPSRPATLRVRVGSGNALRRRATSAPQELDGWTRVQVDFRDVDRVADEVAGYGPDVVAEGPEDLREAVVRRLRGAAQTRHTETAPSSGPPR
jgi:proteasome accessory factor B